MIAEKTMRKHVTIIHAYSLMSVLQRKIVNILLYEATKHNNVLNHHSSVAVEYHIPFSNLCKAVKFNSNNTQYLKESIDGLASLKIEWNLLKDKVPTNISFLNLRVLHGAPTFFQDNTLNYSFHKVMLDLIGNPPIYGTLDVDLQSEFESKYGHALYENSTRFVNLRKNKIIQLEIFRKILGVQKDKYQNMRELTRNVINPSVEEVNDRANFFVNLETVKNGRKIIGFEVTVKSKKKSIVTGNVANTREKEKLYQAVKDTFGTISESVMENILNNHSDAYILEKMAYTRKYAKKENSGLYPIPYFISAIKHDYKDKEELSFQGVQKESFDQTIEWNNRLHFLQIDLNHWKNLLECILPGKNTVQINNIQSIILRCEKKIQQHLLELQIKKDAI